MYLHIGYEAWTLSKARENKIDVMETWCLCQMGNMQLKDHIRNERVLEQLLTSKQL